MTAHITTFDRWPEPLRQKRGLLNGARVQMSYEVRGLPRYQFARKLGMAARELAKREIGWHFWDEQEREALTRLTAFPLAFFTQHDPPELNAHGPTLLCWQDEEGESHCHVEQAKD